jgi:hypothetical protein
MDDRIDDLIRDEARDYNEPPATPTEAMWEAIRVGRTEGRKGGRIAPVPVAVPGVRTFRPFALPTFRLGVGIAALLALGIGIGRWMEHGKSVSRTPTVAQMPAKQAPAGVVDSAAVVAPPGSEAGRELASARGPSAPRGGSPAQFASRTERRSGAEATAYDLALSQHLGQSEAFLTLFRSSVRSGRIDPVAFASARQLLSTNRLLLDSRAGADPASRQLLQDLELVLAQIAQLRTSGDSSDVHIVTEDMDRGDVLPRLRTAVPAGI